MGDYPGESGVIMMAVLREMPETGETEGPVNLEAGGWSDERERPHTKEAGKGKEPVCLLETSDGVPTP